MGASEFLYVLKEKHILTALFFFLFEWGIITPILKSVLEQYERITLQIIRKGSVTMLISLLILLTYVHDSTEVIFFMYIKSKLLKQFPACQDVAQASLLCRFQLVLVSSVGSKPHTLPLNVWLG